MPKRNYKDITGQKFNHLTAIRPIERNDHGEMIWEFRCDCGNVVNRVASYITNPRTKIKACGCLNKKGVPKIDMKGKQFTYLTVIDYAGTTGRRRTMWLCECKCGKRVKVDGAHLRDGHTKSCGCYNREQISNLNKKTGKTNTRIHYVYWNMRNRCYRESDSNYQSYGGRGIRVCDEWLGEHGFENFLEWAELSGYKPDAKRGECTLDRIDVNGNYEPSNCRWVSQSVQCNNKRTTRRIIINGQEDTVANMARKYNMNYFTLLHYSKGFKNCKYPELNIEVVANEQ